MSDGRPCPVTPKRPGKTAGHGPTGRNAPPAPYGPRPRIHLRRRRAGSPPAKRLPRAMFPPAPTALRHRDRSTGSCATTPADAMASLDACIQQPGHKVKSMPGWLPPDGPWACRGRGTSRPRPLFRPQPARYARFLRPGPRKGCAVVPRHFCALWKRRSSNDLGFTRRNGPRSSRPQPGDAPVFPRLGSEGGMLRHAPCFLRDSKTAIFQRFVILASGRSMSDPTPTGKIRPFLTVGAGRGHTSLRPLSLA